MEMTIGNPLFRIRLLANEAIAFIWVAKVMVLFHYSTTIPGTEQQGLQSVDAPIEWPMLS